ncbi:hypothetical protein GE061_019130 [Apolygus lucorum]|uniref:Cuticle protein n=1 Tax=Apolygus lucorum TaxID=248454 RepID=A0A6A4JGH2_APOLU|nr:hypothetical protein GE061_019130 [Apolygus lucorum]
MLKVAGVVCVALLSYSAAYPVTQEELAQYVARQQTSGLGAEQQPRRQAYVLPQAKSVYQAQPTAQVYQIQPKTQQVVYQQQQAAPKQYYQPQAQPEPQQYYQPQPQVQQQYYQSQPQPTKKLIRPLPGQQLQQQEPEDFDPNPQYQFGFDIKDDEFTNYQQRKEQREGDKISGSYSVVDADGYIRTVKYTADPLEGFKADVVREPTDIKIKFPVPAQQPQQQPEYAGIAAAARKQQTQQYLQAASKPQQILRPEHTQVYSQSPQLRQIAAYTGAQQVAVQRPSAYSQQPQVYQSYQEQ